MFDVPRTVFLPAPNVDSAILKMMRREKPLIKVKDEDWLFKIVKIAFAHRRKTLINNLSSEFGKDAKLEIENLLSQIEISPTIRAERLSIFDFAKLSDQLLALKK